MKVLIVDDEVLARARLKELLTGISDVEIIGEASNGLEAFNLCARLAPDIVLMDIRMPGMDGIQAARQMAILDLAPSVIFTTAFGEYALEAFEANAIDYLLKPIRIDRLERALEKAKKLTPNQLEAIETTSEEVSDARTEILCRVRGNLELIPVSEILYFHADQKYVTIKYYGGEVLIEESLKSLEEEFGRKFLRIHRSTLVASKFIIGLEKSEPNRYHVTLRHCDDNLEVSRRHVSDVRKFLRERGDQQ
ncbi:MAG: DNA-binding response regulator [Gammaproteobacteria bacterium]|nr:MAG: DNA-binding response regulator [Gammaproteobacteria bacterium]